MENNNQIEESIHVANVRCDAAFKEIKLAYSNPIGLFIGRFCVAQYVLDSSVPPSNPKKFKVTTQVHSMFKELGHFETEQECRSRCYSAAVVFTNQLMGK